MCSVLEHKNRRVEVQLLLWCSQIPSIPLEAGRGGISTVTLGLGDVFPPDGLDSGLHTQFIVICIPCIVAAF